MSKGKYTSGPWVASKTDRSIGPVSKHDDQSYGMIFPVAWVEFNGKQEHQDADARLIAAAPELLEALQICAGYLGELDHSSAIYMALMDKVNDAIEKALGQ